MLIVLVAIFIVLIATLSIFFLFNLRQQSLDSNQSLNKSDYQSDFSADKNQAVQVNPEVQEIKDAPAGFVGAVKLIDSNSLMVEMPGDIKNQFTINKNEVSTITKLEKNPNFNKEKFDNNIKQIGELTQKDSPQSIIEEMDKKAESDPELQLFTKKGSSWESLRAGDQITVSKDDSEKVTLIINSLK